MKNIIDIRCFIQTEIDRLNILFQKGATIMKKDVPMFCLSDYTYLYEANLFFGVFSVPHLLSYAILKDIDFRILNPIPGMIWYWKQDNLKDLKTNFLHNQFKLLSEILQSYIQLLKGNHFFSALILFRSYIEYSSQFYASLLDYDFFCKYVKPTESQSESKNLWYQVLKPSKVLSNIKNFHREIDQLMKEGKIIYGHNALYRRLFKPFDSNLRDMLYKTLSELTHGSYSSIVKNDEVRLYALVWLCSSYLVESQTVIEEIASTYYNHTIKELLHKWVTIEIYQKAKSGAQFEY